MGCCSSTASGHKQKRRITLSPRRPRSDAGESRAPPPTVDEETVKEVLSETPRLIKPKVAQSVPIVSDPEDDGEKRSNSTTAATTPTGKPVFPIFKLDGEKIERKVSELKSRAAMGEEISELSEICSLSETVSTATNITRDDDDDCDEVGHSRVYRSPMRLHPKGCSLSGDLGGGGGWRREQRIAGKSPSRRSEQSPGRRNGNGNGNGIGSVRMVQAREPVRPMIRRGPENHRRDSGESSARRSRSPAMTRNDSGCARSGVGRSPSARTAARSPSRVNGAPYESNRRVVEDPTKWPTKNTADESLENPLVSLECFIFL